MLELKDVHTHFGLSHVLQGIDLRIGKGEVVGLFGRNSVGKTTVIKTIAGWVPPSRGEVVFEGESLRGVGPDRICRRGIGLVPEDRRIFPGLIVEETCASVRCSVRHAVGPRRARSSMRATCAFPRLAERRRQMGTTLSGGEQQMLAIARVLAGALRAAAADRRAHRGTGADDRGGAVPADRAARPRGDSHRARRAERAPGDTAHHALLPDRARPGGGPGRLLERSRPGGTAEPNQRIRRPCWIGLWRMRPAMARQRPGLHGRPSSP